MKTALFTVALVASQMAFAQIKNNNNESRHVALIEDAIYANCGKMTNLTQIAQSETQVTVDQGITDVKYITLITGTARLDQMQFDQYEITVQSEKSDMYDHSSKNWGAYRVSSVSCVQK